MITLEQVKKMIPTNNEPDVWHTLCLEFFEKYNINTPKRVAGFFAQGGHESIDFKVLFENLNYSWDRLRQVFPKYFPTDAMAKQYHRNPQLIANRVYDDANRTSKLGNTSPGDGYRYRGRGIFQLTGKFNYTAFGNSVGMTAEEASVYCGTKRGAFESACWYWNYRNLNAYCDNDDIVGMSKAVNGGTIGLEDRKIRYSRNKIAMTTTPTNVVTSNVTRMLYRGCRGEDVKMIQKKFGLSADGIFGAITESAVRSWQRSNGYVVTGRLTVDQSNKLLVG